MIRVVRTATLRELREDVAEADRVAEVNNTEADKWNELYVAEAERADAAEDELAEARAEVEVQFEGLHAVIRQVTGERDAARAELDETRAELDLAAAELRRDLDRLRTDAADPDTGTDVQARIALGVLRRLIREARNVAPLGRPLDLVAVIIGEDPAEDTSTHPADGEQAVRHAAAEAAGHVVSRAVIAEEIDR